MAQVTWMTSLLATAPQDGPLLDTKLSVPRHKSGLTSRARLLDMLHGALSERLTLVSAPAGFGKTTLLASWASVLPENTGVAWVSLDDGDNDPTRFWAYCFAALERVYEGLRANTMHNLSGEHRLPVEAMLSALINALSQAPGDLVMVLDDYHVISLPSIHQGMMFLVDHLPERVHLVLACRAEPPFPLARMRARGDLLEVHPADLRFTAEETAHFLKHTMGLVLTDAEVLTLESSTEGWIAGLQLVALSLRGNRNQTQIISSISGNFRYIADYLADEVFRRQPREIQSFLLGTSILTKLCGDLCDHVLDAQRGTLTLEMLEKANLFLEPLDEERQWYRYHHLFQEFLSARLAKTPDVDRNVLHKRACDWYSTHGHTRDAISHALLARDFGKAAELIETVARKMFMRADVATLLGWIEQLPVEHMLCRPELYLSRMWCVLAINHVELAESLLLQYESYLGIDAGRILDDPSLPLDVPDQASFKTELAAIKCTVMLVRGEVDGAISLSQKALSCLSRGNLMLRGILNRTLGVALGLKGDTGEASRALAQAQSVSEATGNDLVSMSVLESMAQLFSMRGELQKAAAIYRQVLASHPETQAATGFAHVRLGRILYQTNELNSARVEFERGSGKCKAFGSSDTAALARVMLSRIAIAEGDIARARLEHSRAEDLISGYKTPRAIAWIRSERARLHLSEGNIAAADIWASAVESGEDMTEVRELEYLMLARARIAQSRYAEACTILDQVSAAAESALRRVRLVESLILLAITRHSMGDSQAAISCIAKACELAHGERLIRLFLDEGPSVARILGLCLQTGCFGASPDSGASKFARLLLDTFPSVEGPDTDEPGISPTPAVAVAAPATPQAAAPVKREPALQEPASSILQEPLSEREMEVLRLVSAGLSNKEIADRMIIALTTVKWHVKNILGKLAAQSRTQATAIARDLRLI